MLHFQQSIDVIYVWDVGYEQCYHLVMKKKKQNLGEIRDLWAKIYVFFDKILAAGRKWLKVVFRKEQKVPIMLVPKKNQNIL